MVFHLYQDVVGNWRWYLSAPNGVKLAVSPVSYARRGDCVSAINRVREESFEAPMAYEHFAPIGTFAAAQITEAPSVAS